VAARKNSSKEEVAFAKPDASSEPERDVEPEEVLDVVEVEAPDEPVVKTEKEAVAPVASKKPLGVKEVIPFRWKLVGTSGGLTLTLFKAVERADVEAQYERVCNEGYYKDARILEIDPKSIVPAAARTPPVKAAAPPPPPPVAPEARAAKPAAKPARPTRKSARKTPAPKKSSTRSRTTKTKKAGTKSAKRPTRKKR